MSSTDPSKDLERLREIADLSLDSPEVDEILDSIAREAAEALDLPTGVVSIVLDEAQNFKAMFGVDGWIGAVRGTPVEWSFCCNVVIQEAEFVVENALEHEIMKDSPLVRNEGIRCYAGDPAGYVARKHRWFLLRERKGDPPLQQGRSPDPPRFRGPGHAAHRVPPLRLDRLNEIHAAGSSLDRRRLTVHPFHSSARTDGPGSTT